MPRSFTSRAVGTTTLRLTPSCSAIISHNTSGTHELGSSAIERLMETVVPASLRATSPNVISPGGGSEHKGLVTMPTASSNKAAVKIDNGKMATSTPQVPMPE